MLAAFGVGCNVADRPQVLPDNSEDVISLPGGGFLLMRRNETASREDDVCYVRARGFSGLAPLPCWQAQLVRP